MANVWNANDPGVTAVKDFIDSYLAAQQVKTVQQRVDAEVSYMNAQTQAQLGKMELEKAQANKDLYDSLLKAGFKPDMNLPLLQQTHDLLGSINAMKLGSTPSENMLKNTEMQGQNKLNAIQAQEQSNLELAAKKQGYDLVKIGTKGNEARLTNKERAAQKQSSDELYARIKIAALGKSPAEMIGANQALQAGAAGISAIPGQSKVTLNQGGWFGRGKKEITTEDLMNKVPDLTNQDVQDFEKFAPLYNDTWVQLANAKSDAEKQKIMETQSIMKGKLLSRSPKFNAIIQ